MGVRRNVGIHAERNPGAFSSSGRTLRQSPQFGFALHIEKQDAGLESGLHFLNRFAYARKHNSLRCATIDAQHPFQLATGDHIESASHSGQDSKNAQAGICFDRVTDGVRNLAEGRFKMCRRSRIVDAE